MAIGSHYSTILALLQSLPGSGSVALAQGAPATPAQAILLGSAVLGTDTHLGRSVDILA